MAKKKVGRPPSYKPEFSAQAFRLCLLGATDEDMAAFFGVSDTTIDNWKSAHPEFVGSLKEGKAEADAKVAQSLYRRALGYEHDAVKIVADAKTGDTCIVPYVEHYPPDTTACIFWLKNRQRAKWRDKQDHEVSGPDGGPIQTQEMSDEQLKQRAALLTNRLLAKGAHTNGNGTNGKNGHG